MAAAVISIVVAVGTAIGTTAAAAAKICHVAGETVHLHVWPFKERDRDIQKRIEYTAHRSNAYKFVEG